MIGLAFIPGRGRKKPFSTGYDGLRILSVFSTIKGTVTFGCIVAGIAKSAIIY